jgi:hypothetical protein
VPSPVYKEWHPHSVYDRTVTHFSLFVRENVNMILQSSATQNFFKTALQFAKVRVVSLLKVLGLQEWLKWLPTIGYIPPPIVSSPT